MKGVAIQTERVATIDVKIQVRPATRSRGIVVIT